MAKKKKTTTVAPPRTFTAMVCGHSKGVQSIAKALRKLVMEEVPGVDESFYGGQRPMAQYRTIADICWIQPLTQRCNLYFMQGPQLPDPDQILTGTSDRFRFAKIQSVADMEEYPLREWIRQSLALSIEATSGGLTFEQLLEKLERICLKLPSTKKTLTWGKPHFRVAEKIFCGCGEVNGRPVMGLKMEPFDSQTMMKVPGIEKAPYSRKNDGWVSIDPNVFDDWDDIERFVVDSFRLIAPKRTVALLDEE